MEKHLSPGKQIMVFLSEPSKSVENRYSDCKIDRFFKFLTIAAYKSTVVLLSTKCHNLHQFNTGTLFSIITMRYRLFERTLLRSFVGLD